MKSLHNIFSISFLVLSLYGLSSLAITGLFTRPAADDYCIAVMSEKSIDQSFLTKIKTCYQRRTGRLSMFATHLISYSLFNSFSIDQFDKSRCGFFQSKNYINIPSQVIGSLSLILLLISIILFIYNALPELFKGAEIILLNLSFIILWLTASLNEGFTELFFWASGWATYTFPLCIFLLFSSRVLYLAYKKRRIRIIELGIYIPILLFLSMFNELLSFILIVGSFFYLSVSFYRKQYQYVRLHSAILIIMTFGFYIMYSSPNTARRDGLSAGRSNLEALSLTPQFNLSAFTDLYLSIPFAAFILLLMTMILSNPLFISRIKKIRYDVRRVALVLLSLALFWQFIFSFIILKIGEIIPHRAEFSFQLLQIMGVLLLLLSYCPGLYSLKTGWSKHILLKKSILVTAFASSIILLATYTTSQPSNKDVLSIPRISFIYEYSDWHDNTFLPTIHKGIKNNEPMIQMVTARNGYRGELSTNENYWINTCIENFYQLEDIQTKTYLQ